MNDDLPPDFSRLPTTETRAAHYLTRIRTWIATVERHQQQPRCPRPRLRRGLPTGRDVPVHRAGAWRRRVSGIPPRRSTAATVGPGAVIGSGQCGARPRRAEGRLAIHLYGNMRLMDKISSVELAAQRQRTAEAVADAARVDVELEAVAAVREGEPVEEVSEVSGIGSAELRYLEKAAEDLPQG